MRSVERKCSRCGGTGRVMRFGHIMRGLCFRCGGVGVVQVRAHRDGSIDHDHQVGMVEPQDRCVVDGCGLPVQEWPPVVHACWYEANNTYTVYVPDPGRTHRQLFVSGETRRKAQSEVRRAVLADLPNARIKWATA